MRRIVPAGLHAVLVELADLDEAMRFAAALRDADLPEVREIVPGARTVLVECAPTASMPAVVEELRTLDLAPAAAPETEPVVVPVVYDGEDLADVARHLGVTTGELVRRHMAARWRVAFGGFAPGFAYQVCDDPLFDVPRRPTPRTRIPAGAVGLAGVFSGVYPRESPGGWQLIGRTPVAVFDPTRDPAVLLRPGATVRYEVADADLPAAAPGVPAPVRAGDKGLYVEDAGLLTLIEDAGRPGMAGFGVPGSGAFDRASARAANRLVGNPDDAAVLEVTLAGAAVTARSDLFVAVTGAHCELTIEPPDDKGGCRAVPERGRGMILRDGQTLRLGEATAGVRSYLAVRGGIDATRVLGSSSTDLLSGLGPAPVASGTTLAVGDHAGHVRVDEPVPAMPTGPDVVLDVVCGPRTDWFTGLGALVGQSWEVTASSNRIGIRLRGTEPLRRRIVDELPSEGAVVGAIQVPADGQPLIFGPDHPLTGGYPVIGAVVDRDLLGQLRPGTRVRFRVVAGFAAR